MAQVVVDDKGFVDQNPVRLQRFKECRKQCAMEIEEHGNHVILLLREFRPFVSCSFKVNGSGSEIWKVPLLCRGSKVDHGVFIAVYRIDVKPLSSKIKRVASSPGRDIKRLAFG